MNKQYKVFSVHHQPAQVDAKLPDGSTVSATVDSVEVQLVPADGNINCSTIKLSFTNPDDIKSAEEQFAEGIVIDVSFAKGA